MKASVVNRGGSRLDGPDVWQLDPHGAVSGTGGRIYWRIADRPPRAPWKGPAELSRTLHPRGSGTESLHTCMGDKQEP